ncbi:ABC transporter permease [Pararhodospirillum oryzae]|uniref:ABC transporter permease n=1 Tax=Pararhodospirillum oryzae TaxID=478448 RepID=A0A512HA47_9PROT|nr:ABC transporter permease subunit [Pararhodospirillum oryzae]GEO82315.1 ABC transporter permease [Pararhodospirillum oryzae]
MPSFPRTGGGRLARAVAPVLGFGLLIAAWQGGHHAYGPLVLPSPLETLRALGSLVTSGVAAQAALETARHALGGFAVAAVIGVGAGGLAGLWPFVGRMIDPLARLFLGIPSIAWVVLSLIWFAGTGLAPLFTVVVATVPVVIAGALQGTRTLDPDLAAMARAFRAPLAVRVADLYGPHMLSYLFPALMTAMGLAWKVAVMAEVLGGSPGIGEGLALARVNLETADALAWVALTVLLLLGVQGLILIPLHRALEPWRHVAPLGPESGS